MNQTARKILFFIIIQVIFYNVLYFVFIPEIYSIFRYVVVLIAYYIITFLDTILRPLQDEERDPESDRFTIILILLFLGNPFFLIASVIERKMLIDPYFSFWDQNLVSIIGLFIFGLSSMVMLVGRVQLGKYATGKLSIQEGHELMEQGLYKYIRHPIYTGGILGAFGYFIAFNSVIITIIYTLLMIVIFNKRANYEEKILREKFGQDYINYQNRTKRYLPFLF